MPLHEFSHPYYSNTAVKMCCCDGRNSIPGCDRFGWFHFQLLSKKLLENSFKECKKIENWKTDSDLKFRSRNYIEILSTEIRIGSWLREFNIKNFYTYTEIDWNLQHKLILALKNRKFHKNAVFIPSIMFFFAAMTLNGLSFAEKHIFLTKTIDSRRWATNHDAQYFN